MDGEVWRVDVVHVFYCRTQFVLCTLYFCVNAHVIVQITGNFGQNHLIHPFTFLVCGAQNASVGNVLNVNGGFIDAGYQVVHD